MKIDSKCQKFLKSTGGRIRKLRLERGWTLEQTEEHGWTSWKHLQKIEGGKNITLATLWNVARLLKVEPGELLGKE